MVQIFIYNKLYNKKFKVNSSDDRFKAIGHDSKFAIDPTNKEFKKINSSKVTLFPS